MRWRRSQEVVSCSISGKPRCLAKASRAEDLQIAVSYKEYRLLRDLFPGEFCAKGLYV